MTLEERIPILARLAYRKAYATNPALEPNMVQDGEDYYVPNAIAALLGSTTYDPSVYATELAEAAIVEHVTASLLGLDPSVSEPYLNAVRIWSTAAARDRYSDRSLDYPDYPGVRMRLRDHSGRL